MLGIGFFAGGIVLTEVDGTEFEDPIIEVQGRLIDGGQVDLWTPDQSLIDRHREDPVYPIESYLAERAAGLAKITGLMDRAQAEVLGVRLD